MYDPGWDRISSLSSCCKALKTLTNLSNLHQYTNPTAFVKPVGVYKKEDKTGIYQSLLFLTYHSIPNPVSFYFY
jgi:hypothetical protein